MKVGDRTRLSGRELGSSLATLYLPATASASEAKRAYRGLLRQLHPDAAGGTDSSDQLSAVVAAYHDLERSGWLTSHPGGLPRENGQLLDVYV